MTGSNKSKNLLFKKVENELNPSRWNKFRNTYSDYKLFVNFKVLIRTNRLSVFRIRNERLKRLELESEKEQLLNVRDKSQI